MLYSPVNMTLEGLNGNAFALLGAFRATAREQGWSDDRINLVVSEATADDYDHLLRTLQAHITG